MLALDYPHLILTQPCKISYSCLKDGSTKAQRLHSKQGSQDSSPGGHIPDSGLQSLYNILSCRVQLLYFSHGFPLPSVNDICEVAFYFLVLKYWCAFSLPMPRCGMWVCSGWFNKYLQSTYHMPCSMLAPVIHNHKTIFILFIFYFTYFIIKLYAPLWGWNSGPTLRSRVMCYTS